MRRAVAVESSGAGGTARAATQAQTEAQEDPVPVFEATVGSLGCCGQSGQAQAQPGVRAGRESGDWELRPSWGS